MFCKFRMNLEIYVSKLGPPVGTSARNDSKQTVALAFQCQSGHSSSGYFSHALLCNDLQPFISYKCTLPFWCLLQPVAGVRVAELSQEATPKELSSAVRVKIFIREHILLWAAPICGCATDESEANKACSGVLNPQVQQPAKRIWRWSKWQQTGGVTQSGLEASSLTSLWVDFTRERKKSPAR